MTTTPDSNPSFEDKSPLVGLKASLCQDLLRALQVGRQNSREQVDALLFDALSVHLEKALGSTSVAPAKSTTEYVVSVVMVEDGLKAIRLLNKVYRVHASSHQEAATIAAEMAALGFPGYYMHSMLCNAWDDFSVAGLGATPTQHKGDVENPYGLQASPTIEEAREQVMKEFLDATITESGTLVSDEFEGHVFQPTNEWPFGKLYGPEALVAAGVKAREAYRQELLGANTSSVGSLHKAHLEPGGEPWCREVLFYSADNTGDSPEQRVALYTEEALAGSSEQFKYHAAKWQALCTTNLVLNQRLQAENARLKADKELLDWLQAQGDETPGLGWVARQSNTGRGYRLHQQVEGRLRVRDALAAAREAAQ